MEEFIWFGRGGQGGVTASRILAMAAFLEGKYAVAFPFFGAERRGAPVKSFTRISDREILIHSMVYEADYAVVLDPSLPRMIDVTSGLKENGVLTMNTNLPKEKLVELIKGGGIEIWIVDATKICLDLDLRVAGEPMVNMPMTGAVAKSTGVIKIESIVKAIEKYFSGKLTPGRIKVNVEAAERAYDEVEKVL